MSTPNTSTVIPVTTAAPVQTPPVANTAPPEKPVVAPAANAAHTPSPEPVATVPKALKDPFLKHDHDYHVRNMDKASPNRNPDGSFKVVYPIIQKNGKQ